MPAVPQVELLFVDPVGCPVDDRLRAVVRQLRDLCIRETFAVEVVLAHIGDLLTVGREGREHERRGLGVAAAELLKSLRAARERQHPVVAARVLPPDLGRVGEDEELRPVFGPLVVVDAERFCLA